jgi:hypothetical protein
VYLSACVCSALHVKVGDFNLSRYMSLGVSYVKSSLEINPVRGEKNSSKSTATSVLT